MSIHATFRIIADRISLSAAGNFPRLLLNALLISMFWMGVADSAKAGYWTAPICYGEDFPVDGDNLPAGVSSALARKACTAPDADILWIRTGTNPLYVGVNVQWSLANGTIRALYHCYLGEIRTSTGFCALPSQFTNNNSCGAGGNSYQGNPVEVATGRKVETTVDWTSGGTSPLTFSRKYSSLYHLAGAPAYSRLGVGWRSNFDSSAAYEFSTGIFIPTQADSGDRIHIVLPDSNEYSFRLNASVWKPLLPRPSTTLAGGVFWDQYRTDLDVALTVAAGSVELRAESGEKYTYDLEGRLVKIVYPTGYSQFLFYSGKFNTKVTDSFGRTITFEYWGDVSKAGMLKSATVTDGKKFSFDYINLTSVTGITEEVVSSGADSSQLLVSVLYPDNTPVTDTDNPKLAYEYLQSLQYPNALTGIYDERGIKFASWTYDSKGRATSSQHSGGDDLTAFSYDDVNNKVTVTNALGRSTVYSFQTVYGMIKRLTAVDGIATTNCAASNTVYAYDTNGFRIQATDAEGRITKWARNSRGLATSTTDGFGSPVARTTTTTWDTTRPLPTQIAAPGLTTDIAYNAASQITSLAQVDTTTTTTPYSTNGQTRTTTFNYTSFTAPTPPAIGPTGTPLSDVALTFHLVKRYGSGLRDHVRVISKPVAGSVVIAVYGTPTSAFALDATK
jgi:YD repeat-containing protein